MNLIASCIVAYWIAEIVVTGGGTSNGSKILPSAILLSISSDNSTEHFKLVTPLSCSAGKPKQTILKPYLKPLRRYATIL